MITPILTVLFTLLTPSAEACSVGEPPHYIALPGETVQVFDPEKLPMQIGKWEISRVEKAIIAKRGKSVLVGKLNACYRCFTASPAYVAWEDEADEKLTQSARESCVQTGGQQSW